MMYAMSCTERRGLSVCRTPPQIGTAKYASRWRQWFQASVATRSPGFTPSRVSALASFCARRWNSPYVLRWIVLSGLRQTISLFAKNFPARSKRCTSVRGTCIISPSMAPSDPGRRVYTLEMQPVVGRKMRALSGGEMHPALLVAAALSAAVSPLTVDEIVARHAEARGGAQRLAALQNLKISGKAFFGGGEDFAVTAEFAQVRKRPNRIRTEVTLQGLTAIDAYDGQQSWSVDPFQGRKDPFRTTADEARGLAQDADLEGALIGWREKGNQVSYLGTEDVDGTPAHKLRVALKEGDVQYVYLDRDYFRAARRARERRSVDELGRGHDVQAGLRQAAGPVDRSGRDRSQEPASHLGRDRRVLDAQFRFHRRRHLQVDRWRRELDPHGTAEDRADHEDRHRSAQLRRGLCLRAGPALERQSRSRPLQDDRRRQQLGPDPHGSEPLHRL